MIIHIVKGVDAHDTINLKAFLDYFKAREWMDNYDDDESFAYMSIVTMDVEE